MDEHSGNGLTPPGGSLGPASPEPADATPPPPPAGPNHNPYFASAEQPRSEGGDKGLGWTAFGTALGSLCVPCLPIVAVVLSVITLARKRFQPRWVPIVALVLGAVLTVGQALLVPSFLDGIKEGIEEEAKDRSGDTVTPMALQKGDCVKDGGIADLVEAQESETEHVVQKVTLVPCDGPHSYEVYKLIKLKGKKFPGMGRIEQRTAGCMPAFEKFVGVPYDQSRYEVIYYYPTKTSWNLANSRNIVCAVSHPKGKPLNKSLKGVNR